MWTPCAGSVTPWQTHLGSEEYPPDAKAFHTLAPSDGTGSAGKNIARYWDHYASSVTREKATELGFNPYQSYEMTPFLMPLDRDTERSPRTRVSAVIARR